MITLVGLDTMANEMVLNEVPTRSITHSGGVVGMILAAGKTLKIETSPNGDDILDTEVPVGKVWNISISVQIDEEDA